MNIEENRLHTFSEWPSGINVNPEQIAKVGFYYEKTGNCLECFSCHLKITNCTSPEEITIKHRQLRPECLFVVDATTSGNVPYISSNQHGSEEPSGPDFTDETMRLQTFHNWPISQIVSPARLARAGFYSTQNSDFTKCAFCFGIVGYWDAGDDPDYEHRRYFPNCPFVRSNINRRCPESLVNMMVNDLQGDARLPNINIVREGNLAELGVHAHKGPKKPQYGTVEARLNTFATWPRDLVQTPDALSTAGFYYEGSGDQVRCFHCDGGLKYWDPHDEPWTEHARWFPYCAFVALQKGQDFISACAPELDPATSKELQQDPNSSQQRRRHSQRSSNSGGSTSTTGHSVGTSGSGVGSGVSVSVCVTNVSGRKRIVTEQTLQSEMLQAPARAALGVGLHVGRVKQAIREKLERTGSGFANGDALIEATLNLQHDEEDHDDTAADDDRNVSNSLVSDLIARSLREAHSDAAADAYLSTVKSRKSATNGPPQPEAEHSVTSSPEVRDAVCCEEEAKGELSLEEENRLLKEARLCKICMDHEVGIVFLPCGHLTTCINCAPNLQDCPVCRCAIKATVRTFLS